MSMQCTDVIDDPNKDVDTNGDWVGLGLEPGGVTGPDLREGYETPPACMGNGPGATVDVDPEALGKLVSNAYPLAPGDGRHAEAEGESDQANDRLNPFAGEKAGCCVKREKAEAGDPPTGLPHTEDKVRAGRAAAG